jgi:hypothetical protein
VSSDSIVKGIIDDIVNTAVKTAEVDEQKTKYLQHFINKHDTIVSNSTEIKCTFHLHPAFIEYRNTCVKHNFKSNFFWCREYNSAKEICKYPSFSKVGGNYHLDLKIIWSSAYIVCWYKTLYQVLPVTWTNHITTCRYHDSYWTWFTQQARPDTVFYQHTMYSMHSDFYHEITLVGVFSRWNVIKSP